ncbi:MAG: segregation/condensation protein A [Chlamydiae bacterium]|nr:segregation/condensation protein A [Chlamydiota bacterium]MBI3265978.1 segregation/condensation protein A [Chlamydiota bacterium]
MTQYKVKLDIFEGPLDLLLYLVKKNEVDIYHIPMVEITDQYLKYLELMEILDLEIAGEFLWMAANLIYIKSKTLLPPDEVVEGEEEDDLDPRQELIRQLLEYKKFKEVSGVLQKKEEARRLYFPREAVHQADFSELPLDLGETQILDLLNAFSEILKKVQIREDLNQIFDEEVSVEQKMIFIEERMSLKPMLEFKELFSDLSSRMEMVATFLALLELIRLKKLKVVQETHFQNIQIQRTAL